MQHHDSDDPWGFWGPETTRELKRTQVGTRVHGETRMVPVVDDPTPRLALPRRRSNPLVVRVGLMLGSMLVIVPIALSLRPDSRTAIRAAEIEPVDTISVARVPPSPAPTAAAETTLPPETDAPTTVVITTAAPVTPAPTEAVVDTPAPTEPPTDPPTTVTTPKKKSTPKAATTAPPPAAATQSAAQSACGQAYTVAGGDSWSGIAARAQISMKNLLAANGATIKTVLLPGKDICLPADAVTPGPPPARSPAVTQAATTQPATTQPKPQPAATQPTPPPTPAPITPAETTAPPTTQPPPPVNTYSKAAVAQIIRDVWPDALEDEAISIATRESNLVPTVRSYCCYGLFQIYFSVHKTWLGGLGVTDAAQLYDPHVNATAALAMYNRSGWGPWALPTTTTTVSVVPAAG